MTEKKSAPQKTTSITPIERIAGRNYLMHLSALFDVPIRMPPRNFEVTDCDLKLGRPPSFAMGLYRHLRQLLEPLPSKKKRPTGSIINENDDDV